MVAQSVCMSQVSDLLDRNYYKENFENEQKRFNDLKLLFESFAFAAQPKKVRDDVEGTVQNMTMQKAAETDSRERLLHKMSLFTKRLCSSEFSLKLE